MKNGIQLEFDDVDASVDQVETETIFPGNDDDDDEYLGCKKYLSAEDLIELAEIKAKIDEDYEADRTAASERKKNLELERNRAVNMKPSAPIPRADSAQVPKYDSTDNHETMAKIESLLALIKQQPKDLFTFDRNNSSFCKLHNAPHDFLQFTAPRPPNTFASPSAGVPKPSPPNTSIPPIALALYPSQMPRCGPFDFVGTTWSGGYQQAGPRFQSSSFSQAHDLNKGAIPMNPAGTSGAYNGISMYNSQPPNTNNTNMANSYPFPSTMPINTVQSPMIQSFNPISPYAPISTTQSSLPPMSYGMAQSSKVIDPISYSNYINPTSYSNFINPTSSYAPTSMNQSSMAPMAYGMAQSSNVIDPISYPKYNDPTIPSNTIDPTNMNQSTDSDLADLIDPASLSKATEPIRLANSLAPIPSSPTQSNGLMDDTDGRCRI